MSKITLTIFFCALGTWLCSQQPQWVQYEPAPSIAKNKHIVFVSGDEEYRSEEALPMLAQILAKKHGFRCTVLFALDPKTGTIDPNNSANIPGLEKLDSADLMVIFTRFRELPDDNMEHIDRYLRAGKPVIGIRTATHAFHYQKNPDSKFAQYDWESKIEGWQNGFGKKVLGETWIAHHGDHGKEGMRAFINGVEPTAQHPVLNGVKDIWCPTDVYAVKQLPEGAEVLLYGQPTKGMTALSPVSLEKTIMPVAWITNYEIEPGKKGRAFTSTMGAAVDLVNEDLRRMFVNACYWALDEKVPEKADVQFVTPFKPTMFGFDGYTRGIYPSKYVIK